MAHEGASLYPPPAGRELDRFTRCRTCLHPERQAIDEALSQGHSASALARRYNLHPVGVRAHKAAHLLAAPITAASRLKADADRLCESAERTLKDAEAIKSPVQRITAVTKATMALRSALDLAARIRGELSNSSGTMAKTHLGMTLDEARTKLEAMREVEAASADEIAAQCVEYLTLYNDAHPDGGRYVMPNAKRKERIPSPRAAES